MALSVKRQVANPDIASRELMQAFQGFVVQCNNFDLLELLDCPGHCHWCWKTAPNLAWMCKLHRLVGQLLGVAPNGVLPSAKVRLAITKLSELMKINQGRSNTATFADNCDQRLRIVMAQYRFVKQHPHEYQRLMKKAAPEEKTCIDKALNLLALEAPTASPAGDSGAASAQLALVPYVDSGGKNASSPKRNIFSKILSKQSSSPDEKKAIFFHGLPTKEPAKGLHAAAAASPAKIERKNASFFYQQGSGGFCVPGDETPSSDHVMSTPVKKKKKSKKTEKNIPTQKRKGISAACREDLSEDDLELVEQALDSTIPVAKGKKVAKKPAAAKAAAKKPKQKTKSMKKTTKKVKDNSTGSKKTTFRHRATSAAYHSAKASALQQGLSPESAKASGRTASRKAGEDIDNGILKDPDASTGN